MKIFLLLFLLIVLTSCGEGVQRISPSGLPYVIAGEDFPEYYEHFEPYGEPDTEEIITPTAIQTVADDVVLHLHMRSPTTLNPLLNEDVTVARVLRLVFEPLAVLDNELRITGHLADLEFASDFSSVNATIREGAIWGDGIPVTADDVIFSIEFMRISPSTSIYSANADYIASAIRIDARTVQIIFNNASVMAGYSLNFPIIPQHFYYGETNPQSENNMNPLGNGAFLFESHAPMRSMTLRRNPYNFRGRARMEQVEIVFLPDTETDFNAFERGRIDAIHLPFTEWTRRQVVRSPVYETFPAMYFEFVGFNFRRSVFRDVFTRQGIAYAFNADELIAGLYLAYAVRAFSPIHPHSWAADDTATGRGYDPARAAALLGKVRADDYIIILANAENLQRVSIAERLAESLTTAGLAANAEIVPFDEYSERLAAHDFDLFIGGMELPFAPDVQIFFQGGELFPRDVTLEAAYSALAIASTEIAHMQAVSALQQAFNERLPIIPLAFRHSAVLANPRITSSLSPTPDHVFVNVNKWEAGVR